MITTATKYDYPLSGNRSETQATLADGRVVTIVTQYGLVLPHGDHGENCAQVTKMGGVCDCGKLDGIDIKALVADARARGLRGSAPVAAPPVEVLGSEISKHLCPKCGTVCYSSCKN